MKKKIEISVNEFNSKDELEKEDRELLEKAIQASRKAYSPYSSFSVGASVRLSTGQIITGNNRENAAFPSSICAERTAIAYAGANYQDSYITSIAICAFTGDKFTKEPVSPCGTCRQVIAEEEDRNNSEIRIILYGTEKIYLIEGNKNLLPLHFNSRSMGY